MTFRKSPGIVLPSIHNVSLRFSAPVLVTRGITLHLRERRSNGKRCDKYTQSSRIDLISFCLPFQRTRANDGNQAGQHCRFFCIYSNVFCPFELLIAQFTHLFFSAFPYFPNRFPIKSIFNLLSPPLVFDEC